MTYVLVTSPSSLTPQFRDLRLIHPSDPSHRSAYPRRLSENTLRTRRCDVCDHSMAERVAYGAPLAPTNPCFFCGNCFEMLHGDDRGRGLGGAAVYEYRCF